MQHRQQDRQPVLLQSHRDAARIAHHRVIHQRLDLHQQRTGAFPYHHNGTTGGHLVAARQEDRRGIADFAHTLLGHGEHAQFVHRAETVFMAAQRAKARVGVAVQQHRTVDTVLQHFRTRQRSIFGDVADHHDRHAARFGEARQIGGGFAHLRHAARRRLNIRHVHHLDRVDHHQLRLFLLGDLADLLDAGFRQHIEVFARQAKTVRAHRHLLQRFFAGDVEGFHLLRQTAHHLQQQRRFPRAGIAADQDGAARHHAAAQHAVKLFEAGGEARQRLQADFRQLLHPADARAAGVAAQALIARRRWRRRNTHFGDGVPGVAGAALPLPARIVCAAFVTNEGAFCRFGQISTSNALRESSCR